MDSSAEFQPGSQTLKDSSSGWKIFGGHNFVEYFGIELTYYDLGSFNQTAGIESIKADIRVFDLSGRGIIPLGERFELFAKLGFSSVDVDLQYTSGFTTTDLSARDWEFLYAIGAAVKLGERFGIRAEYEGWDVPESLDAWSIGLTIRFGGA
jgi:OOP family OmpA-OmpF porin